MRKTACFACALCVGFAFCLGLNAAAQSPSKATAGVLTVVVNNVNSDRGVVGLLVFAKAGGWPEDAHAALLATSVPAHRGTVVLHVPGLPVGDYAVVVLHDVNKNMKLDRTWYGKPREQWGMSNNPKSRFSAPSFYSARFHLSGDLEIHVTLR